MESFWNSSWEKIDAERIVEYVGGFDMKPDDIIAELFNRKAKTVCDAGCGCGLYSLKLAANGFDVYGFDVSDHAVKIAQNLLNSVSLKAKLTTASVLSTGYADGRFDAVISRDVLDHMSKQDAGMAMCELYRIAKPGGILIIAVDFSDEEYESEPHEVNFDGDYQFTDGKWRGMIFHPYSQAEFLQLVPAGAKCQMESGSNGIVAKITKSV